MVSADRLPTREFCESVLGNELEDGGDEDNDDDAGPNNRGFTSSDDILLFTRIVSRKKKLQVRSFPLYNKMAPSLYFLLFLIKM